MASEVSIANSALQKIGASRISSLSDNNKNASAVLACYENLRQSELQTNFWTFAIARAQLSASAITPTFGRTYEYPLPGDFIRMAPLDPKVSPVRTDWLIEGKSILTDDASPLEIRYVKDVKDAAQFHPLFAEALASRIAFQIVEELTQSNTKKNTQSDDYLKFIGDARRIDAIESGSVEPEEDYWISVRI